MDISPPIPPPAECAHEPSRPYTIRLVPPGACGKAESNAHVTGCMYFRTDGSCDIRIVAIFPNRAAIIAHEKGHCNCPWWRHP